MTEPLAPENLAELRRLLDEYRSAGGFAPIIDAWYALARGSIARLPAMLDAAAERDALAAKVERVRDWLDHRGVDASDRDGAYMDGYRAAQRHAVIDAAELRAALDEEAQS